jgi:hypothetical protein
MPGLDREAHASGELAQAVVQQRRLGGERRRQLDEHRPQRPAQAAGRFEEPVHRFAGIAQPPHVREIAADLDRHHEPVGHPLPPPRERLPRREPVEGAVVLYGRKALCVVLQP